MYLTTLDGTKHSMCCMLLTIAAGLQMHQLNVTASQLMDYLVARSRALMAANIVYHSSQDFAAPVDAFLDANPDFASCFPDHGQWAGNVWRELGKTCVEPAHLLILAPLELQAVNLVVLRSLVRKADEAPVNEDITFYAATPDAPFIFILSQDLHYTLLLPPLHEIANLIACIHGLLDGAFTPSPWPRFRDLVDTHNPLIFHVAAAATSCSDLASLTNMHQAAIEACTALPPPLSPASAASQDIAGMSLSGLPSQSSAEDSALDILHPLSHPKIMHPSPFERPVSPSNIDSPPKAACAVRTPQRPGATIRSARRSLDDFSSISQSTVSSSTDLGNLVWRECRQGESRYIRAIGVRGDVSTDETSLTGSFSASTSATSSQSASINSTGSHHPHPTPHNYELPLCGNRHPMTFGRFTEANHTCDIAGCLQEIPADAWGFHCDFCSMDLCTSCWPITWEPQSSAPSSLDASPSSTTSSQLAAPRHQAGANAAARGRRHNGQ